MQLLLSGGGSGSGVLDSLNWKADARVRTSTNVNLAAPGATLDGIAMNPGDSFLASGQTAPAENGIYVWNGAAVPATRRTDANTAAELVNATLTIDSGTSAGTTWRQSAPPPITLGTTALSFVPFGGGDVVGPGAATDNAISVFSGITGKIIKNSLVVLSTIGALLAPAGSAALPAFSPLAGAGMFSPGANSVALSTNSVQRVTVDTTSLTSTLPIVVGGSISEGTAATTLGLVGNAGSTAIGAVTLSNALALTGGAGIRQVGAQINVGFNQTSTASGVGLAIDMGLVAAGTGAAVFGSGGGLFLDLRANSASVAKITAVGSFLATDGTTALPGLSFVSEPALGIRRPAAAKVAVTISGFDYWTFSATALTTTNGNQVFVPGGSGGVLTFRGWGQANAVGLAYDNNVDWNASAILQAGWKFTASINQTSTASFTAHVINMTGAGGAGAPVFGSGGGLFLDCQTNSTSVAKITAAGAFLAIDGTTALPGLAFVSEPALGFRRGGSQNVQVVSGGVTTWQWSNAIYSAPNAATISCGFNSTLVIDGNTAGGAAPAGIAFISGSVYAGTAAQRGVELRYGANQTGAGAFTGLVMNLGLATAGTGVPVFGSAGGFFADFRANSVSQFSVSAAGGMANAAVSPTALAAGSTNDYAGGGLSGFVRISTNAAGSVLTGISATNVRDGFRLTYVNTTAGTLTINHQDAGSAAANRVITSTGVAIVLSQDQNVDFIYDLTTARWRQSSLIA